MDRDQQLRNVAFGGDWSEAIVPREKVQHALGVLGRAVEECADVDPRSPDVQDALVVVSRFTRGAMLADAFLTGAARINPGMRRAELDRVLRAIFSVVGVAKE